MIITYMKGKWKLKLLEVLLIILMIINMFTTAIRSTSKIMMNSPYLPKLRQFVPIPSSTALPTGLFNVIILILF